MTMQSLKISLSDCEYEDFKDLLYTCVYGGMPVIDENIAEIVLKRIEDEE